MAEARAPGLPAAILLDVGGTLLDEEGYDVESGIRTFLEGSDLPGGSMDRREIESCVSDFRSVVEATRLIDDREFELGDWLRTRFGLPPADAAVAEMAVWIAGVTFGAMRGAQPVLEEAHRLGIALAVVSNQMFSGRTVGFELRRQGYDLPLHFVQTSADCGVRKPSPAPFRRALARLDVEAGRAWYIGDDWDVDVVGAARAGLYPIWLGGGEPPDASIPHHRAPAWSDVGALLESCT